jgi:AGZA family xanthine/uracil permease-like MFS transporter
MGLNAYFSYTVVKGMGMSWEVALGAVFISGCLFILVSLFKVREMIINSIPPALRTAITVGIGLFGYHFAEKRGRGGVDPATIIALGDLHRRRPSWPSSVSSSSSRWTA